MSHSNDKHITVSVVKTPGLIFHKKTIVKPLFLHSIGLHEDILPTKIYDINNLTFIFQMSAFSLSHFYRLPETKRNLKNEKDFEIPGVLL